MVRRYSTANIRSLLQSVYNKINITFPPEFGHPVISHIGDRFSAYFPHNIQMRREVNDRQVSYNPIGEGATPAEALTSLLEEYADEANYARIELVNDKNYLNCVFIPMSCPYGTTAFRRVPVTAAA